MLTLLCALEGGVICCRSSAYLLNVTLNEAPGTVVRRLSLWLRKSSSCIRRPTSLFPYLRVRLLRKTNRMVARGYHKGAKPFPNT